MPQQGARRFLFTSIVFAGAGCGGREAEPARIPIRMQLSSSAAVRPDVATYVISGCASGFRTAVETVEGAGFLTLFQGDRDCIVGLRSFSWRGFLWQSQTGGDFSGPGSDVFVAQGTSESIRLTNPERLPSPLQGAARLRFAFARMEESETRQLTVRGNSFFLAREGDGSPGWKWGIEVPQLVGVNAAQMPEFDVTLWCNGSFKKKNPLRNSECQIRNRREKLSELALRLVPDSYANGSGLTWTTARSLFGGDWPPDVADVVRISDDNVLLGSGNSGGIRLRISAGSTLSDCRSYLLMVLNGGSQESAWTFSGLNLDFASRSDLCLAAGAGQSGRP